MSNQQSHSIVKPFEAKPPVFDLLQQIKISGSQIELITQFATNVQLKCTKFDRIRLKLETRKKMVMQLQLLE